MESHRFYGLVVVAGLIGVNAYLRNYGATAFCASMLLLGLVDALIHELKPKQVEADY